MSTKNIYGNQSYLSEARSRLGLAVTELYAFDQADADRIYTRYYGDYGEFFRNCMLGRAGFNPVRNKVQEQLADFPGETMNLYVGVFDCYQPSHCLTLVRNSKGLWQLKKPSVRKVSSSAKAGVLVLVTLLNYGGGVRAWVPLNRSESSASS